MSEFDDPWALPVAGGTPDPRRLVAELTDARLSWGDTQAPQISSDTHVRDNLLLAWQAKAAELEQVKALELHLRNEILALEFANGEEGTNNLELGNGWILKAVIKNNYKLTKDDDTIQASLDKMAKHSNEGKFLSERLINWEPKLLTSEYKKLSSIYKAFLRDVITIEPGQGSLELVGPRVKT